MYAALASFAQTWRLLFFFALFIAVLVYALWPKHQQKFEEAARVPLRDDDKPAAAEEGEADHEDKTNG